jgi:pimeloyl-ACP methyl ester carboxylesterase
MAELNQQYRVRSGDVELVVESFGQGAPIVFAHGLTGNRVHSRRQLSSLADKYRVVVFDQRGHGESTPASDPSAYDADQMAGDMAAIMDHLGIEQAVIGGESMGAATALRFALNRPERVRALVLCLPALADVPNPGRQTVKDLSTAINAFGIQGFATSNEEVMKANGASPEHAAYWSSVLRSHQTESMALACWVVPDWIILHSIDDLAALHMPVQIVAVEGDPVHPLALAQRMQDVIPGAQLKLVRPASDYSEKPETVGHIVRAFMSTLP